MLMQEERELVVEYGKKMSAARLSTGTSGNISIYNAEKGLVAISPSGMDYFSTTPEDVVILDLDGKVVDGKRNPPASGLCTQRSISISPMQEQLSTPTPSTAQRWLYWVSPSGQYTM